MKKFIMVFLILFPCLSFAQNEIYDYGNYFLRMEGSSLEAFREDSSLFYEKQFSNPEYFAADLDSDGVNEFIVIDYRLSNGKKSYSLFVYNAADSLFLADSVNSGSTEPYQIFSKELNTILLVTGNPVFDLFNTVDSLSHLPLNFWKFEEGSLYLANASIYDLYINENANIIDMIEEYYLQSGKSCESTEKIKGAIASGFVNYYEAGEKSFASQFLKNYYFCSDISDFKDYLLKSLK
jgi:hypothetical protein